MTGGLRPDGRHVNDHRSASAILLLNEMVHWKLNDKSPNYNNVCSKYDVGER